MREEMANDPFYKVCCIANETCNGRIEWHHNLIYAGRQVNEKWCILPVCHSHHEREKNKDIGEKLDYVMVCMAQDSELEKYSKCFNYVAYKEDLICKYANS